MKHSQQVFVSTGAFNSKNLEGILEEALAASVPCVELSSGLRFQGDLRQVIDKYSDRITFLVHNYFPPPEKPFVLNLAAPDPGVLERSMTHCRAAIDLAHELHSPVFSVHAGFAFHPRVEDLGRPFGGSPVESRDITFDRFKASVLELVAYAAERQVMLLVENNVVAPFNAPQGRNALLLLAESEEMVRFAEAVDSDNFGYLIDFGHLKVSAQTLNFDREEFLRKVQPWVRALHLSDNDGSEDSNEPFSAEAWFLPWLEAWPEALITLESYRLTPDELRTCLESIRRYRSARKG